MILKSNTKFLIRKQMINGVERVVKYDLRKNTKLREEFELICNLRNRSRFHKTHLIPVTEFANRCVFGFTNLPSYTMPFYDGMSLSEILRSHCINRIEKKNLVEVIFKTLLEHCRLETSQKIGFRQKQWQPSIDKAISLIGQIDFVIKMLPLHSKELFCGHDDFKSWSQAISQKFFSGDFYGCEMLHSNFHGDNILLESIENPGTFKVIDPDSSVGCVDPFFSLARFFYTPIHDAGEGSNYQLVLNKSCNSEYHIELQKSWARKDYDLVSLLGNFFRLKLKPHLSAAEYQKLCQNFIFCLLKGIVVNNDGLEISGAASQFKVRSASIFMLYCLNQFIKTVERDF